MLEWYVYYGNWNAGQIERYNIFEHSGFYESCVKAVEELGDNPSELMERVLEELLYYFWCKCEWEIVLSSWPENKRFKDEKIDVYGQVIMNWHVFIEYFLAHKDELTGG